MNILNKITFLSTLLFLIGCSSYDKSVFQNTESINDKTLSSDFKDEGIKITYSITGNLKSIEVYGQADAWKDNVKILAEADAMSKLVKFIYGNDVTVNERITQIGNAMDSVDEKFSRNNSKENKLEDLSNKNNDLKNINKNNQENDHLKKAKVINETSINTVTNLISSGKLIGFRKNNSYLENQGKRYVAVYIWDQDGMQSSKFLKDQMNINIIRR
jgi:hypothetical protein